MLSFFRLTINKVGKIFSQNFVSDLPFGSEQFTTEIFLPEPPGKTVARPERLGLGGWHRI